MRRIVLTLTMLAALGAAGCNSSSNSNADKQGKGQAPVASKVTGTVGLREQRQLSDAAKLEIHLVDVSTQSAAPLATKTVAPVTQLPVQFELDFNPADINPADLYVVQADLVDGDRTFTMPLQAPVLTKGAPTNVDILLAAQATPAEKMLAAFKGVQSHIGAMKRSSGTALSKDVSRGWQIFRDDEKGDVRFVRELADYGDKGFNSTDYAYKDGKPWVVVQQKKASKNGKPTSINRAGWNPDGELVLKQHEAGGKVTTLDASDAADLKKQAESMYKTASKSKK